MAEPNAQALAMAIEIRRKNKRKTIPTPMSDTVHETDDAAPPMDEFDLAESEAEAPAAPAVQVQPMRTVDAVGMARAIMAKHKAPVAAVDNFEDLEDNVDAAPPAKTANDRIAGILGRRK